MKERKLRPLMAMVITAVPERELKVRVTVVVPFLVLE
jgi:hypothetical protein